jgi:hypothetical protein
MNGGVNGFVGILYELVVIQAILSINGKAKVYDEGGFGHIEFNALIASGKASVMPQYFDTDIAVADADDLSLVQCKASEKGETLTHGDLVEILIEGSAHLQAIRAKGDNRPVSNFIIATNRPISDEIKNLNADLDAFRSRGGGKDSTCPKVLDKGGTTAQSVLDWAKSLSIPGKDADGKKTKIPLDISRANLVAELAVKVRYALVREAEVQKRFRDSLRRYGLNESEIDKVDTNLKGELLDASKRGDDVVTALRRQFSSDDRSLSLCPEELHPLEEKLIEHHWSRGEHGQTIEEATKEGLPRTLLVDELVQALQTLAFSPTERGLVLIGDGGVGKSQLLFEIPRLVRDLGVGDPKEHLFTFVDCRPKIDDPVGRALLPFFEAHRYVQGRTDGAALASRLKIAFDACEADTILWILIPNADELSQAELTDLLAVLTESLESKPRFVLTARQNPWDKSGGPSHAQFLRPLSVGLFEPEEVDEWINAQGALTGRYSSSVTPMRSGALVPRRGSSSEIDVTVLFGHPLSFQALQRWMATKPEGTQRLTALSGLIQGDGHLLTEYMQFLRRAYVDRVFKHSKRFDVGREEVNELFGNLWERKDELSTIAPSRWGDELCPDLGPSQQPDQVVRQFVQAGVLKYTNRQGSRIEWAVPYQP